MDKIYLNFKNFKKQNFNSIAIVFCLLFAIITLSYILFHNPHKDLHEAIFRTADTIRNYYRDHPSYWKLSTKTAQEDNLVDKYLQQHSEYIWHIGQGAKGETAMPNDNSFDIALNKLSKSACINLSELPVTKYNQLGLQKITVINDDGRTEFSWGNEDDPLPIKRYATRKVCSAAENTVIWTFQ
jgi:hypothetical protein